MWAARANERVENESGRHGLPHGSREQERTTAARTTRGQGGRAGGGADKRQGAGPAGGRGKAGEGWP